MVRDWLQAQRARLIASARFRTLALALPLMRPVARRRAKALFDLQTGFVHAQILRAAVALELFDQLAAGPLTPADLAQRTELSPAAAERLLLAMTALDLAHRRRDGAFSLGEVGAAMVANPAANAMSLHHDLLYADLADPVALLRNGPGGGRLQSFWSYVGSGRAEPEAAAAYSRLMAASQALVAQNILAAYSLREHRRLLDVGGGHGAFALAAARAWPRLAVGIFDLPPVVAGAVEGFAAAGLGPRATAHAGDFRQDPLPAGADLITFVRVLHDHDDPVVVRLLRAAWEALPAGGRVLVGEPMAEAPGNPAMGHAYFGLYLWGMGSGRPRTASEIRGFLRAAGFRKAWERPTRAPLFASVVVAER